MKKNISVLSLQSMRLANKFNIKITKMTAGKKILGKILEPISGTSSNEIENIHSTVSEYVDEIISNKVLNNPSYNYFHATKNAFNSLEATKIIRVNDIKQINNAIRNTSEGYRKTPVSIKKNNKTIIHKGIDAQKIMPAMTKLCKDINKRNLNIIDILLSHHEFESIHPFSDGNGRTGRILLSLLLYKSRILHTQSNAFSYVLSKNKKQYYDALKNADNDDKEAYLETMLKLFNESLQLSINFVNELSQYIKNFIERCHDEYDIPEKYDCFLLRLFEGLKVSNTWLLRKSNYNNKTISKYINILADNGHLKIIRNGKFVVYANIPLLEIVKKHFKIK